jgi:hypothetical protein
MRWLAVALLIVLATGNVAQPEPPPARVDFAKHVRPILESKCQPCHFAGGKMYAKLPFDQPSTILTLGERLFTRIHDEKSRATIRRFLAEGKKARP